MDLKGKVVFITGGAEGIGKAIAVSLLEKGCKVFSGDITAAKGAATVEELGTRFGQENVGFDTMDVVDYSRFAYVFNQAVSRFGRVDIMVNCAGVMDESRWSHVVQVNVIGLMNGTNIAMDHMRKDKGGQGGRIINISSVAGMVVGPLIPCYSATKFAVRVYTQCLAVKPENKAHGIEFGVLCPDATDTPLFRSVDDEKLPGWDAMKGEFLRILMPTSKVAKAFLELLQLEDMNGSVLKVSPDGTSFHSDLNMTDPGHGTK